MSITSIKCRGLIKILIINTSIAFMPALMLVVLSTDKISFHHLLLTFLYSLIYANCIGGLNFATIPRLWQAAQRYPSWQRWPLRIFALLANSLVGGLVACLILVAFGFIPRELYWPEFFGSLKIAAFLTLLAGVGIATYETMHWRLEERTLQLQTKELERERALKLATEAQLASLESRIHPHFLFNTLNSISSLIPDDPERAERLLEQMAALLRFSLDANQSGLVPLASELKIVADYLEIEKARFGERLNYRIDCAADLNGAKVPPLSVQTLVENSVKFAIAPNRAGGEILISGTRESGHLRVEVSDEGPQFALEFLPPGHGLDNLKGRLATLFGPNASLTLERHEHRNHMRLSVPEHACISG
jgi:two-component system, LytTR family, sensor histidine kinase AlgZ